MSAPAAPTFSPGPDAGESIATFDASVTVTLSGSGNIFYTTDGSDPRDDGALYSAPFALTKSSTVKAYAVNTNYIGPVAKQDYVLRG